MYRIYHIRETNSSKKLVERTKRDKKRGNNLENRINRIVCRTHLLQPCIVFITLFPSNMRANQKANELYSRHDKQSNAKIRLK